MHELKSSIICIGEAPLQISDSEGTRGTKQIYRGTLKNVRRFAAQFSIISRKFHPISTTLVYRCNYVIFID